MKTIVTIKNDESYGVTMKIEPCRLIIPEHGVLTPDSLITIKKNVLGAIGESINNAYIEYIKNEI